MGGVLKSRSGSAGGKKQLNKNQAFRRQKVRNARTIRTEAIIASSGGKKGEPSDLTESGGMLKVDQFINTREFEIKQLLIAMEKSKTSNATRVFQALPRKLRRRTASHNVKRIPKRMRNRALNEMLKNDQQKTTGNNNKNSSAASKRKHHGLSAAQLYKARMSVKLLRLATKSTSMKLALPNEVTSSKYKIRQKIKSLQKLIRTSEHPTNRVDSSSKKLNNVMGSYDNTGINHLAPIPRGRIKYCKRQREFTWLPTHIWNAKRSHMIKRWGFNIPWSPTQKCFKLTHRLGSGTAASDGALIMDSSFMGTMIVKEINNESGLLKDTINKLTKGRGILRKYFQQHALYEGFIYEIQSDEQCVLGPSNMLWLDDSTIMIRLHPAIYAKIFNMLASYYGDKLLIQDCRYSLASISIRGAKALTALSSVLRSTGKSETFEQFKTICNVTDDNILPSKMLFAFEAIDPRHFSFPKKIKKECSVDDILALEEDNSTEDEFTTVMSKLLTPEGREESYKNQQTLKQLARRRKSLKSTQESVIHHTIIPFKSSIDPSIPLLVMRRNKEQDWVLIVPWYWHLPFWYQLNRISRVYHIGLRQVQQLKYESQQLYFPDDYPFTHAGYMENSLYKSQSLRSKWEKKPVGKRVNFAKIENIHLPELPAISGEIGDYFSCDWKLLQMINNGVEYLKEKNNGTIPMIDEKKTAQFDEVTHSRILTNFNDVLELYKDITIDDSTDKITEIDTDLAVQYWPCKKIVNISSKKFIESSDITKASLPVISVTCRLIRRGHPRDNARVYSIPPEHMEYWTRTAQGSYKANGRLNNDEDVPLPSIHNLIGFITAGTYHIGEGRGIGNGFITAKHAATVSTKFVLIRNVGTNVYRLAEWEPNSV